MDFIINILLQIFQQFNLFFVIVLILVLLVVFGYLVRKGKEFFVLCKIGIGMMIVVCGFLIMVIGFIGLFILDVLVVSGIEKDVLVFLNWLIFIYLVFIFVEFFLLLMGIFFVLKVVFFKYKGMMMGGWFVVIVIGNYLVVIIGYLWGGM